MAIRVAKPEPIAGGAFSEFKTYRHWSARTQTTTAVSSRQKGNQVQNVYLDGSATNENINGRILKMEGRQV